MAAPHDSVITAMLEELCVQYGYCLPPDDQARLIEKPPSSVDDFTDTVLRLEGLDPALDKSQRRQVRSRVARWMGSA